jgi:Subtilase family
METLGEEIEDLVKIAALDTGIDLNHPCFETFIQSGQLDCGLDLINEGEPIIDLDGHGTHVCHLLFKTAPYAKVYPIRVFKNRTADKHTPSLIKKVSQENMTV